MQDCKKNKSDTVVTGLIEFDRAMWEGKPEDKFNKAFDFEVEYVRGEMQKMLKCQKPKK